MLSVITKDQLKTNCAVCFPGWEKKIITHILTGKGVPGTLLVLDLLEDLTRISCSFSPPLCYSLS